MIGFRAYKKSNVTGTTVEAVWLFRLAVFKLYATLGLKAYRLMHNTEVKKLTAWRKEFNK